MLQFTQYFTWEFTDDHEQIHSFPSR